MKGEKIKRNKSRIKWIKERKKLVWRKNGLWIMAIRPTLEIGKRCQWSEWNGKMRCCERTGKINEWIKNIGENWKTVRPKERVNKRKKKKDQVQIVEKNELLKERNENERYWQKNT